MKILGLDIGYSNLKCSFGPVGQIPTQTIIASGAAPEACLPQGIRLAAEGVPVLIEGEPWRIGLPHGRFEHWSRTLHQNYSDSLTYRALFHGALVLSGEPHIEKVVTGLPVTHWQDSMLRAQLALNLTGKHQVTMHQSIEVAAVEVIPQPLGAYLDLLWQSESDASVLSEGRILVIDPGFFSVDWIVIEAGALRKSGAGSSLSAMSVLIQEAAELIEKKFKGQINPDTIEDALRRGRPEIFLFGESITLRPFLNAASKKVAIQVVEQVRESIRRESGSVDVVILAGGGASFYRDAIIGAFGQSRVMMSEHPEGANARGFFYFGEM